MEADARRLRELELALKRLNEKAVDLRKKKKDAQEKLYRSMEKNGVEKYEGYTMSKIRPKAPAKRKPAKAKKSDAIRLFSEIGIDDPEELYEEFKKTQRMSSHSICDDEEGDD
jgi:hypothetical protein